METKAQTSFPLPADSRYQAEWHGILVGFDAAGDGFGGDEITIGGARIEHLAEFEYHHPRSAIDLATIDKLVGDNSTAVAESCRDRMEQLRREWRKEAREW